MAVLYFRHPQTGEWLPVSSTGTQGPAGPPGAKGDPGPAGPLDVLTDVTAPADTPAGKVLGTTAEGQWGPVDVPSGLPDAPFETWTWRYERNPSPGYSADYLDDGVAMYIYPDEVNPEGNQQGLILSVRDLNYSHRERAFLDLPQGSVLVLNGIELTLISVDVWNDSGEPNRLVLIFSDSEGEIQQSLPPANNGDYLHIDVPTGMGHSLSLGASGPSWEPIQLRLDELVDTRAPVDTPGGMVLGTTAPGTWEPVRMLGVPPMGSPFWTWTGQDTAATQNGSVNIYRSKYDKPGEATLIIKFKDNDFNYHYGSVMRLWSEGTKITLTGPDVISHEVTIAKINTFTWYDNFGQIKVFAPDVLKWDTWNQHDRIYITAPGITAPSDGDILTVDNGVPTWQAPAGGAPEVAVGPTEPTEPSVLLWAQTPEVTS